jgi:peptide/nickel transport system ATP-binding protein
VPIPGRPPSLINLPSGCSFHPRCPYVREAHKRIDPKLEPLPDDGDHKAACLLPADTRKRIWRELKAGKDPEEARAAVNLEEVSG